MNLVGRKHEQSQLQDAFDSRRPEFIAVYGRRRIGKTYLIREFFKDKNCFFFQFSGINKEVLKIQLMRFKEQIENTFYNGTKLSSFKNWYDSFKALKDAIEIFTGDKKVVIFLDEIPWMATPKSKLLNALDYYWNSFWSMDPRIKLIICGSAASWIIDNVLHNTGGLHNRTTLHLVLKPFSLFETKSYLNNNSIYYNNDETTKIYMSLGGIPYYLNLIKRRISATQNINNIFFNYKSSLYDEFEILFASLFSKHEIHKEITSFIAKKREGVTRSELESYFKTKGGRLTARLNELEKSGFIMCFKLWNKKRGVYYKVIDEYSLFYLSWVKNVIKGDIPDSNNSYWEVISKTPAWQAWSGLAFESICYKHINQIKKALYIPQGTRVSSWKYISKKHKGAQIDLVFDRPDNTINLCEIKYCKSPFLLDKQYSDHIQKRTRIYCEITQTEKQIFHSMVVASGLKNTEYSKLLITSYAVLDDLFQE